MTYEEIPIAILDRHVQKLRNNEIASVKVLRRNQQVEEATWEAEEEILAGRLDVAVTEPLHLAQDAAKGKPVLGFSRFLHTDGGVLYDAGKGDIKRPEDMYGKTIS